MKQNLFKEFVEDYFKINKVEYTLENQIYIVQFKDVLANKLGKTRKFSFNKNISDDYGVEHLSINNDLFKYILRESTTKGQIIKASLDTSILNIKETLKLNKNILIISEKNDKNILIAFLFKISSTNNISETTPEHLRYVLVDYENLKIISEDLANEFHNIPLVESHFKFDTFNVNKAHTTAYEYLIKDLESKYVEHDIANKEFYQERIEELKNRHEEFKKNCKREEKKLEDDIKELDYRISAARSFDAEEKYEKSKNIKEKNLEELKNKNKIDIGNDLFSAQKRIEEEKEKFEFEVKLYLTSCVVSQYDISILKLKSVITNEETEVTYNKLIKEIKNYQCPLCNNASNEVRLSLNGHFCCDNCSSYYSEEKGYLCKKDDVAKCIITGKYVPKKEEFECYSCKGFYDKEHLQKDILKKNVCKLCVKKTYNHEIINKKDAIYSKKYDALFKPSDVKKCEYSLDWYPLTDLEETSGSEKLIAKEFIKKCKIIKLTFTPDEMEGETSELANHLKEINTEDLKYKELKTVIPKNKVEYNENKLWCIVKVKGLIMSKYIKYNIKDKKVIN